MYTLLVLPGVIGIGLGVFPESVVTFVFDPVKSEKTFNFQLVWLRIVFQFKA